MNEMERLTKCPLCKSGLFLNHLEVVDRAISQEKFNLCQCSQCSFIFTNPRPSIYSIDRYYHSEDYISHQDKSNNLTNLIYKTVRKYTLHQKVKWLNSYNTKKGKLLDIGCGTGYFLQKAQKSKWKVTGIEPNKTARKIAKKKGLKIYSGLHKVDLNEKFDSITLFHVLEHIHDLRKTGKLLHQLLNKKGSLFIAVPNIKSFDAKYYGKNWAGLDLPRHLYHFSQETLTLFAKKSGFEIHGIIPMKFDSFYVSLLSEKYLEEKNLFKQYLH